MRFFLLCLLVISLILSACRQQPTNAPEAGLRIDLALETDPPQVGPTELRITLTRQGQPIEEARLEIRGDMAHAGMVPVLRSADADESGETRIPFEWTMGGLWFVEVIARLPDGSESRRIFEYEVAAP